MPGTVVSVVIRSLSLALSKGVTFAGCDSISFPWFGKLFGTLFSFTLAHGLRSGRRGVFYQFQGSNPQHFDSQGRGCSLHSPGFKPSTFPLGGEGPAVQYSFQGSDPQHSESDGRDVHYSIPGSNPQYCDPERRGCLLTSPGFATQSRVQTLNTATQRGGDVRYPVQGSNS